LVDLFEYVKMHGPTQTFNFNSRKLLTSLRIQSSPFITISLYATLRLLRLIFCGNN